MDNAGAPDDHVVHDAHRKCHTAAGANLELVLNRSGLRAKEQRSAAPVARKAGAEGGQNTHERKHGALFGVASALFAGAISQN